MSLKKAEEPAAQVENLKKKTGRSDKQTKLRRMSGTFTSIELHSSALYAINNDFDTLTLNC